MKNYIIFGCGKKGKILRNYIENDENKIVNWADNNICLWNQVVDGISVLPPNMINSVISEKNIDGIIISTLAIADSVACQLNTLKIQTDVYIVPEYLYTLDLNDIWTNRLLFKIDISKPRLYYYEFRVNEQCNLKCEGCGAFSNIAEKQNADLEQYKRDIARLKELFWGVRVIRLLGGEPTLNNDLSEFVEITRDTFPDADLRIVSNGLLISDQLDNLLKRIRKSRAAFDITLYPPTAVKKKDIVTTLESYRISYHFTEPVQTFFKVRDLDGKSDGNKSFKECMRCYVLCEGKLAQCGLPIHAHKNLKKYFDIELFTPEKEHDYIDIHNTCMNGWEINELFESPKEFCKFCRLYDPEYFEWSRTKDVSERDVRKWCIKAK